MSPVAWMAAVLTLLSVDTLAIAHLIRRGLSRTEHDGSWFDHHRFVEGAVAERIEEYVRPIVIAHPSSFGGDLLEYPIGGGWDENAILATLAEIEAL